MTTMRQRGFTLVEAVMVIVIIGVLGGMVAMFIRLPVQGFVDTAARAEMTDNADLALRRMARDLRLALPNSIRVTGTSIEFLMTTTGGRYLSAEDEVIDSPVLDFTNPAHTTFTIVGDAPSAANVGVGSNSVVVYNLGPGFTPADAYAGGNRALITGYDAATKRITMASNPFGAQNPPQPSPTQRFAIISGPVTYACGPEADGTVGLTRQSGYAITASQVGNPVPSAASTGQRRLLAARVAGCAFTYSSAANRRSGLAVLALSLQAAGGNSTDSVTLVHQVHVDNTP